LKSNTVRNILLAALGVAMALSVINAEARPGSPSSSRSSYSSPSKSTSSYSNSRSSSTSSSGMSRSNVMATARQQSSAAAPVPSRESGASTAPAPSTVQPRQGYSGGTVLGAVAAGYLLHSATHPDNQGAPSSSSGGGGTSYAPAEMDAAPQVETMYLNSGGGGRPLEQSTDKLMNLMSMMFPFMTLVVMASFGFSMFRSMMGGSGYSAPSSSTPAPAPVSAADAALEAELLKNASETFRRIEDAYSRCDHAAAASLVDDSYLKQFSADMTEDAGSSIVVYAVKVLGTGVLGFEKQDGRYVGSIHYQADISENGGSSDEIEEVWHFVRPIDGGTWKLAGIEQV
jgi:hypothetical protein